MHEDSYEKLGYLYYNVSLRILENTPQHVTHRQKKF